MKGERETQICGEEGETEDDGNKNHTTKRTMQRFKENPAGQRERGKERE